MKLGIPQAQYIRYSGKQQKLTFGIRAAIALQAEIKGVTNVRPFIGNVEPLENFRKKLNEFHYKKGVPTKG